MNNLRRLNQSAYVSACEFVDIDGEIKIVGGDKKNKAKRYEIDFSSCDSRIKFTQAQFWCFFRSDKINNQKQIDKFNEINGGETFPMLISLSRLND